MSQLNNQNTSSNLTKPGDKSEAIKKGWLSKIFMNLKKQRSELLVDNSDMENYAAKKYAALQASSIIQNSATLENSIQKN